MRKTKPCPARIWSLNGKRVDIRWNNETKKWDRVRPIPEGAVEYFCDGDAGHEGTCCGSRSREEYERLGGKG
jgi:hypothetical protein